jgi:hypothetical protein
MGSWMSNTMMRALKTVASGTSESGAHSTLPMSRLMASTFTRFRVTFEPSAAHGTPVSSYTIAYKASQQGEASSDEW